MDMDIEETHEQPPRPGTDLAPSPISPTTGPSPEPNSVPSPPLRGELLDLIALLVLITVATSVFAIAGPAALTSITGVGVGLFTLWRSARTAR